MKKIVLVFIALLLCSCSSANTDEAIKERLSSLESRVEYLESKVDALENETQAGETKKEKENKDEETQELKEEYFDKGETLSLTNGEMAINLTLEDVFYGRDKEEYKKAFFPNYDKLNEYAKRDADYELERYDDWGILVFEFEVENTGTIEAGEKIFTRHNLNQNGDRTNYYINIQIDGKYNYGCNWRQTDDEEGSFGTDGINVGVLKTETLYLCEILPEEVFGKPFEVSFTVGDTIYKYKGNGL